jgi:hypothetical protein
MQEEIAEQQHETKSYSILKQVQQIVFQPAVFVSL